jgi:hypothetical protein
MRLSRPLLGAIAATTLVLGVGALAPASSDAAKPLLCRANMDKSHPADNSTVHVIVKTAARANVHAVAHYKTTNTGHARRADKHGNASIPFDIGSATPGSLVSVTVTVTKKGHPGRTCKTSFRPHG